MQTKLSKSKDNLGKAQESERELDLARSVVVQAQTNAKGEWDQCKADRDNLKAELD